MDFSDERYVRVYIRDTATWALLEWHGTTVLMHLMRKMDRAGTFEFGREGPFVAIAAVTNLPVLIVQTGLRNLVERGTAVLYQNKVVVPNFTEAQEAKSNDRIRQQASRARRRGADSSPGTAGKPVHYEEIPLPTGVTDSDMLSQIVTSGGNEPQSAWNELVNEDVTGCDRPQSQASQMVTGVTDGDKCHISSHGVTLSVPSLANPSQREETRSLRARDDGSQGSNGSIKNLDLADEKSDRSGHADPKAPDPATEGSNASASGPTSETQPSDPEARTPLGLASDHPDERLTANGRWDLRVEDWLPSSHLRSLASADGLSDTEFDEQERFFKERAGDPRVQNQRYFDGRFKRWLLSVLKNKKRANGAASAGEHESAADREFDREFFANHPDNLPDEGNEPFVRTYFVDGPDNEAKPLGGKE